MLNAVAQLGGRVLRAAPVLERPVFGFLKASNTRPFRSLRFRLFKAWGAGLDGDRAVRLTTLPGGVRLTVDVRDWCGITYIEPEAIEPATTAYLLSHLRPGDVFLDIGANVGYMSLRAAERVGPTGAVWSFEPNPRLVELLTRSVHRNRFADWVHLVPVALAEADDPDRPFYVSQNPDNSGISSLTPDEPHRAAGRMADPIRVRAVTLDTFAAENHIDRVDAVKIDVEGAEELVLRGMQASLARFRPRFLIVETELGSPTARMIEALDYRSRMLEPMGANLNWGNVLFELSVPCAS